MSTASKYNEHEVNIPGLSDLELISEGGFSLVYKGHWKYSDRPVVLKLSKQHKSNKFYADLFSREAKILASIQNPYLIDVLHQGESDGYPFILLEYFEGQTLADWLRQNKPTESQVLSFLKQIALGLNAVHQFGVIHRDLKPENILVSKSDDIKIIDLGLAEEVASELKDNKLVGSLLYSAPEQIKVINRAIDQRSDLYSMGAILFELLTGKPPYATEDFTELCQWHSRGIPPNVEDNSRFNNPSLNLLASQLLCKDPNSRPSSIGQIFSIIGFDKSLISRPFLVGREDELNYIDQLWRDVEKGQVYELVVTGSPGIGKSYLINTFYSEIKDDSVLFVKSKSELGINTPLYAIHQFVQSLVQQLPTHKINLVQEACLERFKQSEASIICNAFPSLNRIFQLKQVDEILFDNIKELFRLLYGFLELMSKYNSMIILFDDIQWMDFESLKFLESIKENKSKGNLKNTLLIYCSRDDEQSLQTLEVHRQSYLSEDVIQILLKPLETADSLTLIHHLLGKKDYSPELENVVMSRSLGNPFATFEFVRLLKEEKLLNFELGKWNLDSGRVSAAQLPNTVIDIVLKRIDTLPKNVKSYLQVAAVAGGKFNLETVRRISKIKKDELTSIVRIAREARLIDLEDQTHAVFIHDRIIETLESELTPKFKAQLHVEFAQYLSQEESDKKSDLLIFSVAEHVLKALDSVNIEFAFDSLMTAGLRALQSKLNDDTLKYLRPLRKRLDQVDDKTKVKLLTALAEVNLRMCRIRLAYVYLRRAIQITDDKETRAELLMMLGRTQLGAYDLLNEEIYDSLNQAIRVLGAWTYQNLAILIVGCLSQSILYFLGINKLFKKSGRADRLISTAFITKGHYAFHRLEVLKSFFFSLLGYLYGHRSGVPEKIAKGCVQAAMVIGTIKFKRLANFLRLKAMRLSKNFTDRQLQTEIELFNALALEMLGSHIEFTKASSEIMLEKHDLLHPINNVNLCTANVWSLLVRGFVKESQNMLEIIDRIIPKNYNTFGNPLLLIDSTTPILNLMARNNKGVIDFNFKKDTQSGDEIFSKNRYMAGSILQNSMAMRLFQDKVTEPDVDWHLEAYQKYCNLFPFYTSYIPVANFYIFVSHAYMRLWQNNPHSKELKEKFRFVMKRLWLASELANWRGHLLFLKAMEATIEGKSSKKIKKFLYKALAYSREKQMPWVEIECTRQLAILAREERQDYIVEGLVSQGLSLAQEVGFEYMYDKISKEFSSHSLSQSLGSRASSVHGSKTLGSHQAYNFQGGQRFETLKNLSIFLSNSLDFNQQISQALEEIVSTLGADRGMIFKPDNTQLSLIVGVDRNGNKLGSVEKVSREVVRQVLSEKRAVVYTGGENAHIDLFKSVVVNDIRSVIAVPLYIGKDIFGVLYFDNELVSGIFSRDDIEVLTAMANQISFAMKLSEAAKLELKQMEIDRDLEVSSLVQSMLIPEKDVFTMRSLHGTLHYESASKTGGDWLWYDHRDHRSIFMLGDISGHGIGAAMVVSIVAGSILTFNEHFSRKNTDSDFEKQILSMVSSNLENICSHKFCMTSCFLSVDHDSRVLTITSSACPPILLLRKRKVSELGSGGTLLGMGPSKPEVETFQLEKGDRILAFTDGLNETRSESLKEYGTRRLAKFLVKFDHRDPVSLKNQLLRELADFRGEQEMHDDLSFFVIDVT